MTTHYTRSEHMSEHAGVDKAADFAAHRRYYAQFVNDATKARVARWIGVDRLMASTDPYFNDIPLKEWDQMEGVLPMAIRFKDVGDFPSSAGYVCVAKEAARQIRHTATVVAARWDPEERKGQ